MPNIRHIETSKSEGVQSIMSIKLKSGWVKNSNRIESTWHLQLGPQA